MRHIPFFAGGAAALVLAAALAGCAPQDSNTPTPATSPSADACAKDQLKTVTSGKLTIGTDDPVYPPWFTDNKPDNGQGYEGAVAAAVATKMGYTPAEVTWVRVTFNNAIAPGPKKYDFDINEFSITEERKQAVDFSAPYYDVTQAVIALKSSKIAGAKSLADLANAKLGAQIGTTSYQYIKEFIKPSQQPAVFDSNDAAVAALKNGQIDGLVVDLPTAFYVTAVQVPNSKIVGQFPTGNAGERFGMVFQKGNKLVGCVNVALNDLKADGTLQKIQEKWLAKVGNAPILH